MLPTIDFNNIDELIDYIDTTIITNHNNEILAEMHNNIENGLAKFIREAPRNWDTAKTVASAGNYVAATGECLLIFKQSATGTITLTDNKWNEWTLVNRTLSNKQLVGSISSYRTVVNTIRNYISPLSSVTIAKGDDGLWYEISNTGTANPAVVKENRIVEFTYGSPDSLSADGSTYVIADPNASDGRVKVYVDGILLPVQQQYIPLTQSSTSSWSPGLIQMTINNSLLQNNNVVQTEYGTTTTVFPNPEDSAFYATLNGAETKSLLDIHGNIFLIPTNSSNKVTGTIYCNSDTDEAYVAEFTGKLTNTNNVMEFSLGSGVSSVGINPFGDDFTFDNIVLSADNTFLGLRISITGIDGKVIYCKAIINSTNSVLP